MDRYERLRALTECGQSKPRTKYPNDEGFHQVPIR
jgi:hypothetical protein